MPTPLGLAHIIFVVFGTMLILTFIKNRLDGGAERFDSAPPSKPTNATGNPIVTGTGTGTGTGAGDQLVGVEDQRTVDSYLPNYIVDVQRRCLPGEIDTERDCIRKGCPNGMERGSGSGSELCYARCIDGYDSNGMSRCFKRCPSGFKTNETTCINPGHTFKKDIVPCKGCLSDVIPFETSATPKELVARLKPVSDRVGPIVMTETGRFAVNLEPVLDVEYLSGTVWGSNSNATLEPISEYFKEEVSQREYFDVPPTPAETVTINLRDTNRIDAPDQPCPRGYTLSGNLCYENCPPHYRDTNDGNCVKQGYTIDRESYDRGAGVPFSERRPKFEHLYQH